MIPRLHFCQVYFEIVILLCSFLLLLLFGANEHEMCNKTKYILTGFWLEENKCRCLNFRFFLQSDILLKHFFSVEKAPPAAAFLAWAAEIVSNHCSVSFFLFEMHKSSTSVTDFCEENIYFKLRISSISIASDLLECSFERSSYNWIFSVSCFHIIFNFN